MDKYDLSQVHMICLAAPYHVPDTHSPKVPRISSVREHSLRESSQIKQLLRIPTERVCDLKEKSKKGQFPKSFRPPHQSTLRPDAEAAQSPDLPNAGSLQGDQEGHPHSILGGYLVPGTSESPRLAFFWSFLPSSWTVPWLTLETSRRLHALYVHIQI